MRASAPRLHRSSGLIGWVRRNGPSIRRLGWMEQSYNTRPQLTFVKVHI